MHDIVDAAKVEAARGDVGGEEGGVLARREPIVRLQPRPLLHAALEHEDGHVQRAQ